MSAEASKLAGIQDGVPLPEAEAKALWKEFSEHMDVHRGDMSGFAKKKGWFSVLPEFRAGKAVLIVRTTATAKAPPPAASPPRPKPRPKAKPPAKRQGGAGQGQAKGKPPAQGGGEKAPQKKRPS